MLWPSRIDYTQAVGYFPHVSILDTQLQGGTPQKGSNNYLIVYSGGFSTVFPIEVLSNTFALRCWIADIGEAETRYKEISNYLNQCSLPYFVDFAYVPEGILVDGNKYPIIRMEWAGGDTLCDFINQNLQDAGCLKTAAAEFQKMVETLHTHQISHGDLQDGNILLKRNGADVEIKLIDYDSVFVPALRGQPDYIVGVPAYQHPQRIAGGGGASEKVDYFSELVIYLSLLSLVEKPDLWSQFGAPTEKRLLFTAEDFKNPDQSDLFRELASLSSDVKHLASKLKEFCRLSISQLKPLEAVLPKTSPAQDAYVQGLAYLHCNRYNEAIVEFEKAIVLDPNYKEAHHGLGLAHFQMSNFGKAKKAAEAALSIDIHFQPAHQLLDAIISSTNPPILVPPSSSKKPSKPTPKKSATQAAPPKSSPAQDAYDQGLAHLHSNGYDEAVVEFEKAIGLDPNYKEAHHGLGLAHFQMRNFGKAKKAAEAALRIDPHYQLVLQLLDAIKSSVTAPAAVPPSPSKKPSKPTPKKSATQAAPPKSSPAQDAYDQGLAHLHSNGYDEAVVEFEKAIGLDPNYKEAHHGLGLAHFQMRNFGKAKKAAEAALRIDPHYQLVLQLLDAIKSSVTAPAAVPPSPSKKPSGPGGAKPTSHSSPSKNSSSPTSTKPVSQAIRFHLTSLNRWQYLTGALAFALAIFLVVFLMQMNSKNEANRRIEDLQNEKTSLQQQLDARTTATELETLEKEKSRLQDDNKNLRQQIETRPTAADLDSLEKKNARLQNKIKNLQAQLRNPGSAYPGKHQQTLAGHTKGVFSVAFSPDELTVASGSWDRTIRLWDAVTGAHRRTLTAHTGGVYSVAFSPDGQLLVSGSDDKTVRLWDAVTGAHHRTLTGHTDWVYCVAFSPDGRTIASGSDDHTTRLWDVLAGIHRHTLIGHTASVRSVAFSPDGDTLASGSFDKTIRLWNGATGKHQRTLAGHTDWVYSVAFSPDGRTIASGSWDRTIRLWDPVTGAHQRTLTGHTAGVYCIAFSPDGRTIASGGMDHTVRLWDVVTGTQLQTLTGHTDGVYSVGFRPDSRMLASGSLDKTIRLID